MNEYRFDDFDGVVDQDDKIIYDDVTQRTGGIIADLLNNIENLDADLDSLQAKFAALRAERDDALANLAVAQAENRALRSLLAYELTLFDSEVDDKIAEALAADVEVQP